MLGIDAGRLASMSYNLQPGLYQDPNRGPYSNPSLVMAANGFGTRIRTDTARKISIPSLPTISTSSYDEESGPPAVATPRGTARAHLLASLRTAPKTPPNIVEQDGIGQVAPPVEGHAISHSSTPPKYHSNVGVANLRIAASSQIPSVGASKPPPLSQEPMGRVPANYRALPTPPASSAFHQQNEVDLDSKIYTDLLARNISLAQQQQILQQQMRMVQQAQLHHQLSQLHLQSPVAGSFGTPPISPAISSPTSTAPFANQALYSSYNPLHGAYYPQHQPYIAPPQPATVPDQPVPSPSRFPEIPNQMQRIGRSSSPAKAEPSFELSPAGKTPSPPPANITARRGHKKCSSLSSCINVNSVTLDCGPKTSVPKFSNTPSTPINSTFGGRGDHPIRQPKGPPGLEEVLAKPTSKHEGSKNFASRQRKRAFTRLLNAGMERRGANKVFAPSSSAIPPISENEVPLDLEYANSDAFSSRSNSHRNSPVLTTDDSCVAESASLGSRRNGLGVPHQALSSAEKRRSALF